MADENCCQWLYSKMKAFFRPSLKPQPAKIAKVDEMESERQSAETQTDAVHFPQSDESFAHLQPELDAFRDTLPQPRKSSLSPKMENFDEDFRLDTHDESRDEMPDYKPSQWDDNELFHTKPSQNTDQLDISSEFTSQALKGLDRLSSKTMISMQEMMLKRYEKNKQVENQSKIDVFDLSRKPHEEMSEAGLNKRQIDSIISNTFQKSKLKTDDPSKHECNICFLAFDDGIQVKILQCLHTYHKKCIDEWLCKRSTCPDCNFNQRLLNIGQMI